MLVPVLFRSFEALCTFGRLPARAQIERELHARGPTAYGLTPNDSAPAQTNSVAAGSDFEKEAASMTPHRQRSRIGRKGLLSDAKGWPAMALGGR